MSGCISSNAVTLTFLIQCRLLQTMSTWTPRRTLPLWAAQLLRAPLAVWKQYALTQSQHMSCFWCMCGVFCSRPLRIDGSHRRPPHPHSPGRVEVDELGKHFDPVAHGSPVSRQGDKARSKLVTWPPSPAATGQEYSPREGCSPMQIDQEAVGEAAAAVLASPARSQPARRDPDWAH